jgi:hypothetical protein
MIATPGGKVATYQLTR